MHSIIPVQRTEARPSGQHVWLELSLSHTLDHDETAEAARILVDTADAAASSAAIRLDGRAAELYHEAEQVAWDNLVAAVSPALRSRAEAEGLLARLAVAIEAAWPEQCGAIMFTSSGDLTCREPRRVMDDRCRACETPYVEDGAPDGAELVTDPVGSSGPGQ